MVVCFLALAFLLVWITPAPDPSELVSGTGQISAIIPDGQGRYRVEFITEGGEKLVCSASVNGLPALLHWAERCPYAALSSAQGESVNIRYLKMVPYEVATVDGQVLLSLQAHRQARAAAICGAVILAMMAVGIAVSKQRAET